MAQIHAPRHARSLTPVRMAATQAVATRTRVKPADSPPPAHSPPLARMAEGRGGACQNCHIWGPLRDLLLVTGFLLGLLAGFAFFVYYYEEHFSVKLMGSRLEKS